MTSTSICINIFFFNKSLLIFTSEFALGHFFISLLSVVLTLPQIFFKMCLGIDMIIALPLKLKVFDIEFSTFMAEIKVLG